MDDFAGSADAIAEKLVAGGMDPQQAMTMALRMAQSRQQADQSILGGVPTQPPVSDVPPATEILGGDPSKLFQRQPTAMERIKDLPKDVLGAGEALVSLGSLAALAPASMMYALRPGQKTQGDPMEFALRNMYMPRSERGPSHLAGLGEVLESLPQTGPLPELQAFTGVGRGVGRQLTQKARQAGEAMAPKAADIAEDILSRQGLLMRAAPESPKAEKTPYERSLEQGYEHGWFHGTTGDIREFDPKLRGETTGAASAKKGFFFVRDPIAPPESMTKKSVDPDSIALMKKMGYTDQQIEELNKVSFEGNAAETASGYSKIGGSREYKVAMRLASAAERRGDWAEYEKQTQRAEDAEISRMQDAQRSVAAYGEKLDELLDAIQKAVYSKKLDQKEAEQLDEWYKKTMPYGWYNKVSDENIKNIIDKVGEKVSESSQERLKKLADEFISARADRMFYEQSQQGANVIPAALRFKNPKVHDFKGESYRDVSYSDLVDQAIKQGHDALILRNTYDPGGGPAKLVDVGVVFEPSQIRSKFAKFDPKDIRSADITKNKGGSVNHKAVASARRALEKAMAKGGIAKAAGKAAAKAAEAAGMKAPVTATKNLTTLEDFSTSFADRIKKDAADLQNLSESLPYKYDAGQRVFTEDSAKKNNPPYTILERALYGRQLMRGEHPTLGPGYGKVLRDPETGEAFRTPYEPGYRVRMELGPDDVIETILPEKAIKGSVEFAKGGKVGGLSALRK